MFRFVSAILIALALLTSPSAAGWKTKALVVGGGFVLKRTAPALAAKAVQLCVKSVKCQAFIARSGEAALGALAGKIGWDGILACLDDGSCFASADASDVPAEDEVRPQDLPPPGNCGEDEYNRFNSAVQLLCKRDSEGKPPVRACKGTDDAATMTTKMNKYSSCIDARKKRESACFGGGNDGHVKQINDLYLGINNCLDLMEKLK